MKRSETRLGNVPSGAAAAVGVAQPRRMPYRRRPPGGATRFLGFISAWLMLAGAAWATEFSCSLSLSDSPDPVPRGDTVSFVVTTNGPNITPPAEGEWVDGLNTVYEWNLDGEATWHPGTPPPVNTTPLEPGPHVMACRCTATYRFGWVDEDENTQYSGWTTQNVPAASTVFTVVQVVSISAGGVTSTKATPGNAETLVIGKGDSGQTIPISAAANLDVWPAGYPVWIGGGVPAGSNGSASIDWPIDTAGVYTVSAACGTGYSVALKIYVCEIGSILVRRANQTSAPFAAAATIAAGAKTDSVHQADVKMALNPVPPTGVAFSIQLPVEIVNYAGFNGVKNAAIPMVVPNPSGMVTFTATEAIGVLQSSDVMRGAVGGLAPCQINSLRSTATASVTFAPSNYDADDRWASSVEYILPDGTSDETVTMELDGAPLVGHDMHFFVEKVELLDCMVDPPAPVTIENTAAAPDPSIATLADFTTNQAATGSDGKATGALWTEDVSIYGYEWVSVTLRAYDYDALSAEDVGSSSVASTASADDQKHSVAFAVADPKPGPKPDLVLDSMLDPQEIAPGGFLALGGVAKTLIVSLMRMPPEGTNTLTLTWTNPAKVEVKEGASVITSKTWNLDSSAGSNFMTNLTVRGVASSGGLGDIQFTLRYNGDPRIQDTLRVTVFKVDLNKILSDQCVGADVNRLPPIGAQPDKNRPMLMGCAVDTTAKVKVETVVQPSPVADWVYLGVRPESTTTILNSTLMTAGQTSVQWEASVSSAVFEMCGGVDVNGNGALDADEVCTTYGDGIRVINQSEYTTSKTTLQLFSLGGGFLAGYPTASALLSWFLNNTANDASVSLSDARLTHPVGVSWSGSTGQCSKYNFTNCDLIVLSGAFQDAIIADASASHYSEMSTYFASHPGDTHVFGPWVCTLSEFVFPNSGNAYDMDMYYAFHDVGTVTVTSYKLKIKDVSGNYQVQGHQAQGYFYDLYDFAYGSGTLPTIAVRVQAGYPSLGTAGRVFKVDRVNFDGSSGM